MKSIVSLLAIAAMSLVASARAQEESPSPSPSASVEEKPSAIVEAPSTLKETSPSPSAAEKSTSTSSATKKTETAASPSPSAEKKTSASAEKTASKKAVSAADTGSAESNVKRLENEWEAAVLKKDASFIQSRIADDFIGTSSRGKRLNKATLAKEFKSDPDTYTSTKNGSITVHAFGNNVAVATGTAKEVGKTKDGKEFSRAYAWTDTWMLRGNQWQCIGSQAMLISGK
jgi:ketosteroid isomerase-like protein